MAPLMARNGSTVMGEYAVESVCDVSVSTKYQRTVLVLAGRFPCLELLGGQQVVMSVLRPQMHFNRRFAGTRLHEQCSTFDAIIALLWIARELVYNASGIVQNN